MLRASTLGLVVSKTVGESALYDVIVDCSGRLSRVQVKSVAAESDGAYRLSVTHGGRTKRGYSPAEIDFVAAYVIPHNAWYIIPASQTAGIKSIHVCPHRSSNRRFEAYREAWRLLCQEKTAGEARP